MPALTGAKIHGLAEMQRAFARANKDLSKDLRVKLRKVAEPVRSDAEARAVSQIANVGGPWSRFRTGVTSRSVYVAPRERGRRSALRRPNFAQLLMDRAMQPALDAHANEIEHELGNVLDEIGRDWGRGG